VSACLYFFRIGDGYRRFERLRTDEPVPLINQPLVPTATPPGGPAFTLTVDGTGSVSGSVVKWNGTALATMVVNGSELVARVPASDIATAATATVTVVSPTPGGGTSNGVFFQITNATSSVSFQQGHTLQTGSQPEGIAIADFNGDGKFDIAIANGGSNTVSIFLGNGDGTFQPSIDYATLGATQVIARDLNGDGKLDLALPGANAISVLIGNGNGTFAPHVDYQCTGFAPFTNLVGIAAGDFNGDGKLDLVATDVGEGGICVFLGNGDGTFQYSGAYLVRPHLPTSIVAGDFNKDGKLDVALADTDSVSGMTVSVLLGNGDGTFGSPVDYPIGTTEPSFITAADFNRDGNLDLVASGCSNGCMFSVLLGKGDGTFGTSADYGDGGANLAVGDFNGDGNLDLVSPEAIYLGNEIGGFGTEVPWSGGVGGLTWVAAGDFTGSGRLDLAASNYNAANVSIFLQEGGVTLSPASLAFSSQTVGASSAAQNITVLNVANASIGITAINLSNNFAQTNSCPVGGNLQGGMTCTISVSFSPTAGGSLNGSLSVMTTDGSSQTITLIGTGQDFSVSTSGAASATITPGQTASYSLMVSPSGGFSQSVAFTCSGAPSQSTCAVSPSSVTLSGSAADTITVSVTTAASLLVQKSPAKLPHVGYHPVLLILGFLGLAWLGGLRVRHWDLRPRLLYSVALVLLLYAASTMSACGGESGNSGSSGGRGNSGTPAGSYMLTVSGTFTSASNTLMHNTSVTLVVQ